MANSLSAFLSQNAKKIENKKIVVSDRFVNPETGEPMEWEIQAVSSAEIKKIRNQCTRSVPMPGGKKGQFIQQTDTGAFEMKLAVKSTVFPNLNNVELQESYGVKDAESLLGVMLSGGEFDEYSAKISELCGYELENNLIEEAKN